MGVNFPVQNAVLLATAMVAVVVLRRVVPSSLAHPERFPEAPWGWPEGLLSGAVAAFFIATAAASTGQPQAQVDVRALVASLMLYGALVTLVLGFLIFRGFHLAEAFGLNWKGFQRGAIAAPAALLLVLPFVYLAQDFAYRWSGPDAQPQAIVTFLLENSGWRERGAVCAIAVLAAPVTEELVFRGCLYGIGRKFWGCYPAMFSTSLLFALIHGHLPSLPGLFILAVALVLVYERTGSLWAPILMHAVFNGLTIFLAINWPELVR